MWRESTLPSEAEAKAVDIRDIDSPVGQHPQDSGSAELHEDVVRILGQAGQAFLEEIALLPRPQ